MRPERIYISRSLPESELFSKPDSSALAFWIASVLEADWDDKHHGYLSIRKNDLSKRMAKAFRCFVKAGEFTVLKQDSKCIDIVINNKCELVALTREE